MPSNRTVLEKADLQISDLVTDGGYLQPAQAQMFIRHLIDEATLLKDVRVVPMRAPKQLIEGIRFGSRVMRPGVSGQALAASDRVKPNLNKVELDAVLVKAQIDLDDEVLEDNIEQGTLKDTVMEIATEQIAVDKEELEVQGDTASTDAFLALYDGMLKSTTSNVTDAGVTPISDTHLRNCLKVIPSAALRNRTRMKFYTSVDAEIDYRHLLSQRGDALGAINHDSWKPVGYSGIGVQPVPMFPENLGGGTNETRAILCDPKSWAHGIWRRIKIESQKDIKAGVLSIVFTMRIHGKWVYEPHTAKIDKIKVA